MSKFREMLATLGLLALIFSGPAAVGAYLVSSDEAPQPMLLAAIGSGGPAPATSAAAEQSGAPVLAGVLYTRGRVIVDWNGVRIPVEDGSYAYLGGEVVSTGPGDMGVLRLDGDNRVYMCPDSRMSLARGEDGAYEIMISRGAGRFAFAPGTEYRIDANRGVLSPGVGAASQPTVAEVTVFNDHPGGVVCNFSSPVDVAGYPAQDGGEPVTLGSVGAGEVVDLSRALRDEAAGSGAPVILRPIPMPETVRSWLRSNAPYPPARGSIGYLCRCEELKRYAEADGIPDAAIEPRVSPPATEALAALPASGSVPPVALPNLPAVVVAAPGPPGPVDLGVSLESQSTAPTLTVPPPLVPVGGTGGGVTSTPS